MTEKLFTVMLNNNQTKPKISRLACARACRSNSNLIGNPEDKFSHDEAHVVYSLNRNMSIFVLNVASMKKKNH